MIKLFGTVIPHKKGWTFILEGYDYVCHEQVYYKSNRWFKTAKEARKQMRKELCERTDEDFYEKYPQYMEKE